MADLEGFNPVRREAANHIEINLGNVFTIGLLSLLWYGFADWTSAWLASKEIPVLSHAAVGAQVFFHGTKGA